MSAVLTSSQHKVVSRKEWLAARIELWKAEKDLTHRSDDIAKRRQALPWMRIDKQYRFDTDVGNVDFASLFKGRSQLLMYHLMFGPDYDAACATCTAIADQFDGFAVHLLHHDVMFTAVSRAPLTKLEAYKQRMGWKFPWASSFGTDFNYDFNVAFTEEQQRNGGIEYNFQREPPMKPGSIATALTKRGEDPVADNAAMTGTDVPTYTRERPGISAFALEDGVIYHTYSAFSRGIDGLMGFYQWLDRAPKGRNETGMWIRRRDEYDDA